MATNREVDDLLHATAFDANGDKLGSISEVFINDSSGQPDFVEINHGLFGMGPSLVPLRGHTLDGDDLRLAFPKDRIKDAPSIDADANITREMQTEIYRHYGLETADNRTTYPSGHHADEHGRHAEHAGREATGHPDSGHERGYPADRDDLRAPAARRSATAPRPPEQPGPGTAPVTVAKLARSTRASRTTATSARATTGTRSRNPRSVSTTAATATTAISAGVASATAGQPPRPAQRMRASSR